MEHARRHEEVFILTGFGVLYYSAFWQGEHCLAAGVAVHEDLAEAIDVCTERERVLERALLLLPR